MYENFRTFFFLEISVLFAFYQGISGIFFCIVRFSEIQQFMDFLELFPLSINDL